MATIVSDIVSHLQCGEAIAIRDAIHIDDVTGKIVKYDALNPAHVFSGIAKEAGVLDDFIRVVQTGRVRGFTGLTPGQFVYASTTAAGSFQLVEPIASQKVVLGIAKSATELTLNGGLGIKPGGEGGGGGLDAFYTEDMEGLADTTGFSKGNNALFMGGGTMQGTLDLESVSPISDLKSLKYTQAAGSINDYFASELIDLDLKQRDGTSGMTFYFKYDGNDNDGRFVVYDVTNSREIASEVNFVKLANKSTRYSLSFYVPASCTQIRWGYKVLVANVGKILLIDDVEMSTDPFVSKDLIDPRTVVSAAGNAGQTITVDATDIPFIEVEDELGLWDGDSFTVPKDGDYIVSGHVIFNSAASRGVVIYVNGSISKRGGETVSISNHHFETSITLNRGDVVSIRVAGSGGTLVNDLSLHYIHIQKIPSSTSHILTPSDTFSTDTAPLTYAGSSQYTLSTLANAPIGTFITFTYDASTNTRTQTNAAPPAQSTSDMNQNGIQIFTRAYNAASTAGNPAAIAIQIGKGLKAADLKLYKNVGKDIQGSPDRSVSSTDSVGYGARIKDYNELTGILIFDSGWQETTITGASFLFSDLASQNNGYLTINAGRTLPLLAVPVPLVAYLKDVKPSGTAGGTFTAGAWQTRTLNTVEGDGSIVSLSASQFTLGPGKYEIEASAPGNYVGVHKLKLRNITDSSDSIIGTSELQQANTAGADQNISLLIGTLNIASPKVFELQHMCGLTRTTDGFGSSAGFGVSEVYTQLKISKVG